MIDRFLVILVFFALLLACGNESSSVNSSVNDSVAPASRGYDEMSSSYYESETRVVWQRPEVVLNALGDLEGKTIADIGAGTGFFGFRVAAAGASVIAIDVDPRAIAFMDAEKERYPQEIQERFTTRQAEAQSAMLNKGEVDVVLMVNTYIYLDDRIKYFKNLRDGLVDQGKVVIIDFKRKQTTIGPKLEDRISLLDVEKELDQAGFSISKADDQTLQYQYIVEAVKR